MSEQETDEDHRPAPRREWSRLNSPARPPKNRIPPPEKRPSRLGDPLNAEDVLALLPFRVANRDEMFDLYDESIKLLGVERKKATDFLANVPKTNRFDDSFAMPVSSYPMLNKSKAWGEAAASHDRLEALATVLADDLRTRAEAHVKDFTDALEFLINKKRAGKVVWHSDDTCTYTFFTCRDTGEQKTTVRHSESRGSNATVHRTETYDEQIRRHTEHEHHLLDARRTAVDDPSVTPPARVRQLIEQMPESVRKVAYLVVGTQRGERRFERDVKTEVMTAVEERVVNHPKDPCLAIFNGKEEVVLTGWTTAEVAEESRQRAAEVAVELRQRAAQNRASDAHLHRMQQQKERQTAEEESRRKSQENFCRAIAIIFGFILLVLAAWLVVAYWSTVLKILLVLGCVILIVLGAVLLATWWHRMEGW